MVLRCYALISHGLHILSEVPKLRLASWWNFRIRFDFATSEIKNF